MSERRRIIRLVWISTIIVVVIVGLFLGGALYYTGSKAGELKLQLDSLTEKVKVMAAKWEELPQVHNQLGALQASSRELSQLIPNDPAQKELVTFLQQNVDGANCEVISLNMKAPGDLKLLSKTEKAMTEMEKELDPDIVDKTKVIEVTMTVHGGFTNVLAFIENLKRSKRFLRIDRISAPGRQGGTKDVFAEMNTVDFELTGEFYYTTAKMDIAEMFDELKRSLEEVLPAKPVEQETEEERELIRVGAVGTEVPAEAFEKETSSG